MERKHIVALKKYVCKMDNFLSKQLFSFHQLIHLLSMKHIL